MTHHKLLSLAAVLVVLGLGAAACSSSSAFDEPSDPLASEQYAIDQMNLQGAWDRSDGEGIVIAAAPHVKMMPLKVLGADVSHSDLAERV